jgi:signal transduction histidine kinase
MQHQDQSAGPPQDRLALLAALARPVQHDLNNLLTVVMGNLDLLRRKAVEAAGERQCDRALEAARAMDAAMGAMLGLLRRPGPHPVETAPGEAMTALLPLLRAVLPGPRALAIAVDATAPRCRFDRALWDEALLGLAVAAAAAGGGLRLGIGAAADGAPVSILVPATAAVPWDALRALAGTTLTVEATAEGLALGLRLPGVAVARAADAAAGTATG